MFLLMNLLNHGQKRLHQITAGRIGGIHSGQRAAAPERHLSLWTPWVENWEIQSEMYRFGIGTDGINCAFTSISDLPSGGQSDAAATVRKRCLLQGWDGGSLRRS